MGLTRRRLLGHGARGTGMMGLGWAGGTLGAFRSSASGPEGYGPLQGPDANGLRLPLAFTSRVVAVSGNEVGTTEHPWHFAPDGGATFSTGDGGWVYVSNSERFALEGGVGAIRFARDGGIVDAYSILTGTSRNCAGGPTPWRTWLSCEEVERGGVYECDPLAPGSQGKLRSALGHFNHEAAAVDPVHQHVYLTEDEVDGLLYRFTPDHYPDLSSGTLEVAEVAGAIEDAPDPARSLVWHRVPDPGAVTQPTRYQVAPATRFNGGEGCWYGNGRVYFSTKGDDRVWWIETGTQRIGVLYDRSEYEQPQLSNVDNVFVAPSGDVYVAEDPGDLQVVALTPEGGVHPLVQVVGHKGSEITGPALSPDGSRLYFSSQRKPGMTFEVTGPFMAGMGAFPVGPMGQWLLVGALAAMGVGTLFRAWRSREER
ncbi:PhoX family protein [Myxococcota bacterium]|nr:PhoX family protein [Myxococcota bacterium]